MKVFMLCETDDPYTGNYHVIGLYATKEKAEEILQEQQNPEFCDIEEVEVKE